MTSKKQNTDTARYINPMTDYGFKKIFGEKDILIAFLTDLLNPASPIEDVIFMDKELKPKTEEERTVIYDLRCQTADGGEFIVEMQNQPQECFSNRILYYLSGALSRQGQKGDKWNFDLHPVYGVFFLNFPLRNMKRQSIRTVRLKVDETGEVFTEKLAAYILELHDYKGKSKDYPKTQIEYWLYNLVNMETMTTALPFQAQQPIFEKLGGVSELAHLSPEERRRYQWSLDLYRSNRAAWEYAGKEAREQGLQEGLQQGRAEGLLQAAQAMLASGMSKEQVAAMLGIDAKQL